MVRHWAGRMARISSGFFWRFGATCWRSWVSWSSDGRLALLERLLLQEAVQIGIQATGFLLLQARDLLGDGLLVHRLRRLLPQLRLHSAVLQRVLQPLQDVALHVPLIDVDLGGADGRSRPVVGGAVVVDLGAVHAGLALVEVLVRAHASAALGAEDHAGEEVGTARAPGRGLPGDQDTVTVRRSDIRLAGAALNLTGVVSGVAQHEGTGADCHGETGGTGLIHGHAEPAAGQILRPEGGHAGSGGRVFHRLAVLGAGSPWACSRR